MWLYVNSSHICSKVHGLAPSHIRNKNCMNLKSFPSFLFVLFRFWLLSCYGNYINWVPNFFTEMFFCRPVRTVKKKTNIEKAQNLFSASINTSTQYFLNITYINSNINILSHCKMNEFQVVTNWLLPDSVPLPFSYFPCLRIFPPYGSWLVLLEIKIGNVDLLNRRAVEN